ncbi:MAG TPA: amidase [Gemmatimonadales bacterium]|nr:amidase [Gemmatimonadales bacterium]
MQRREFLRAVSTATAAGLAAAPAAAAMSPTPRPALPTQQAVPPFELADLPVAALQEGMTAGRWTSRRLVELYLERIEAVDRNGPALRSVIETNPDALRIADELDTERRARGSRGPLHGIPLLVKDNLDTADRMETTAGSLALVGVPVPRDSDVVDRLRRAGVVILGKTNLSEWANFRSTASSSGWSARGGQTRNPYVLDRNPCGSSSGSGSAAAASLAAVTIGTETDGSIVCPSSICGLVGIKPTVGLVSRAGIIPIAASQDTAGPMCRSVADAAQVLAAIQGYEPRDPATARLRTRPAQDYAGELRPDGLRGARLGVARKGFGLPASVEPVLAEAIAALKSLGATVLDPADLPGVELLGDPEFEVLLYEFKQGMADYLAARGGTGPKSLTDLMAYNTANREREMPWFGQEIFERAAAKGPLTSVEYRRARGTCRRLARTQGIDAILGRHRLNALVAMTTGPAWPTDYVNGDRYTGGCSSPAAVAGYPHVTVPAGSIHGLPVGLSFFGAAWSEPALIRYAFAFEQGTRARKPPTFRPTL